MIDDGVHRNGCRKRLIVDTIVAGPSPSVRIGALITDEAIMTSDRNVNGNLVDYQTTNLIVA